MRSSLQHTVLEAVGMLVLVPMPMALSYAAYISLVHWNGIGV